jgi:arylsulfatase A-like enzyme
VVLVLIDALRPDFIGPDGDRPSLTPNLDAFAAASTSFSRAYTTAPGTREAARSMLSGCFHLRIPPPDIPRHTLFSELHERGIANAAVVAHPCIEAHFVAADRVYDGAFEDKLAAGRNARTSAMQTEAAMRMLDGFGPDAPFVLFVHYYDPHEHYVVDDDEIGLGSKRRRYAVEVAHTDAWIGRLLQAIDARGLDDVAVLVTSDHGDELWDHHGTGHLTRVYEESARVLLAARVPGAAPHVEDGLVSLTDVYPTVRELLGLPIPADLDGRSLVPALDGAPFSRRAHLVVQARDGLGIVGVLAGDHKLIVNAHTGVLELYDLSRDPGELVNLADDPPIDLTPLLRVATTSHVGAWPYRACPN